ncbi:hypothetical protein QM996_02495 [Sinorhizobium chiapasense]
MALANYKQYVDNIAAFALKAIDNPSGFYNIEMSVKFRINDVITSCKLEWNPDKAIYGFEETRNAGTLMIFAEDFKPAFEQFVKDHDWFIALNIKDLLDAPKTNGLSADFLYVDVWYRIHKGSPKVSQTMHFIPKRTKADAFAWALTVNAEQTDFLAVEGKKVDGYLREW